MEGIRSLASAADPVGEASNLLNLNEINNIGIAVVVDAVVVVVVVVLIEIVVVVRVVVLVVSSSSYNAGYSVRVSNIGSSSFKMVGVSCCSSDSSSY